ncbi:MAG: DUF1624 domain-containing protein, partial [Cytophagaceae bacterium]|nr:DUF1624 domain-containing protein [Gemmatimonadaceae bacterium]
TGRVPSIDIVRGAVMVLMAIDHVRVYAGVPAGGPTPGLFFTRWVTHFCAPVFVFLAGTSAYLYAQKVGSRAGLAEFLVTRGLWLVLLELTVLRFAWTFNFDYAHFTFAGVIWMIGWCMVLLAGLAFLPTAVVTVIGLVIVLGHNAVAPAIYAVESPSWLLRVLYAGGSFQLAGTDWSVVVLYVLVPWIGVMALGYGLGAVMRTPAAARQRTLMLLGLGAILLFVVLRASGLYGDPRPWGAPAPMPRLLAFLNTAKYPASLLFLLMTLGPALVAMSLLDQARGRVTQWLQTFGKVPFFYYVLHIPLIHLVAAGISLVRTPESAGWLVGNYPMDPPPVPEGYPWSLPLLYLVTAFVVTLLYFACRWYARVKAGGTSRWLGML